MKKSIVLICLCLPLFTLSQDLTGIWEGSGGGTTYIRMVVKHRGDSLFGYTYDEGGGYCKATFIGRYDNRKKRLVGHGVKMLEHTSNHVLVDYDLLYSKESRGEFLRENLGEEGLLERIFGSNMRLYLKKTSNKVDPPKPAVKPEPPKGIPAEVKKETVVPRKEPAPPKKEVVKKVPEKASKPPIIAKPVQPVFKDTLKKRSIPKNIPVVTTPVALIKKKDERISKLLETIYISTDTIHMFVYDNGEVDGDTVTVFFDNAVILNRYRISEKAKEIAIPVSRDGAHIIELFANNLGTIPPNTALIIIMSGKKRYELHASYDLKTNAKIIIQYRE